MREVCPVGYDHTEDLDECMVCGWTGIPESQPATDSKPVTGQERIREAIKILNGGYAPKNRIVICGGPE